MQLTALLFGHRPIPVKADESVLGSGGETHF